MQHEMNYTASNKARPEPIAEAEARGFEAGVRSILEGSRVIGFNASLANALGGPTPGLFLQNIMYWSGKAKDGWSFRTQDEIREETALTRRQQDKARKQLKDRGLLEEKKGRGNRLYYRPVWRNLKPTLENARGEQAKPEVQNEQGEQTECSGRADSLSRSKVFSSEEEPGGSQEGEKQESSRTGDGSAEQSLYPGVDSSVGKKQAYYIGYLHERLEERGLADGKPLTDLYKKKLAGEIGRYLKKTGAGRGRMLLAIDRIVHRWSAREITFGQAWDDTNPAAGRMAQVPEGREDEDPRGLSPGESCWHRGREVSMDEDGQLWSGGRRVYL